ncbi:MAG: hypothetical protein IJP02_03055 [Oscillospiraceae bacterium]|nr:hypothetical protein [Oscillospiraceae bacterium]
MKTFCFTVDDNIRFLKELTVQQPPSLFDHPYTAMLRRLHDRFGVRIQLNLFYEMEGFDLSRMTDRYRDEWQAVSDWLRLSFHSHHENPYPYEHAPYEEVYAHCKAVHDQILRFAGPDSLGKTTTVHCCRTTPEGLRALQDNGVTGLLGLYGTEAEPRTSYRMDEALAARLRSGQPVRQGGISFAPIDLIVNLVRQDGLADALAPLLGRESLHIMVHEQYFYPDYRAYHPDFEQKLALVFDILAAHGYQNRFFEQMIH